MFLDAGREWIMSLVDCGSHSPDGAPVPASRLVSSCRANKLPVETQDKWPWTFPELATFVVVPWLMSRLLRWWRESTFGLIGLEPECVWHAPPFFPCILFLSLVAFFCTFWGYQKWLFLPTCATGGMLRMSMTSLALGGALGSQSFHAWLLHQYVKWMTECIFVAGPGPTRVGGHPLPYLIHE